MLVNKNFLTYKDYKVKCAIGKRGIGKKRREGDLITPKGLFKIKKVYFRKDKVRGLKTKFSMKAITKNMGWCNDPKSNKYNKLIKYPFAFNAEKLFRNDNIYDIVIVLNFNSRPVKKNKGSAIFLHVARRKYSPTLGCVAISKNDLKYLLSVISKKTFLKIF